MAERRSPLERFGPFVVLALSETALVLAIREMAREEWRRGALLMNLAAGLLLGGILLVRIARARQLHAEPPTTPAGLPRFSGAMGAILLVAGSFELVAAFDRTGVDRWMLLIGGPFTLFLGSICLTGFFIMLGKPRE